jgi:drug/metabolite transporter (DMT)-like permease
MNPGAERPGRLDTSPTCPGVRMPVLLALLSACATAVNLVLQRDSSRAAPESAAGWRLAGYLVRSPRWLLGQAVWVLAFALQALALHVGRLSVVQPVLVTQLVFTLVIRRFVSRWPVRAAAWGSAALLCSSLVLFLFAAEPRGGHPEPTSKAWGWALLAVCATAAAGAYLGRRGSPERRAACLAAAAAVLGAFQAALVKAAVQTLTARGLLALLSGWPLYLLLVLGAATTILVQAALHAGPLTVSQPLLVVVNPLVAIALSLWLYGEHFTKDAGTVLLGASAFAGLVVGVVLLTLTGPRTPEEPAPEDASAEPHPPRTVPASAPPDDAGPAARRES